MKRGPAMADALAALGSKGRATSGMLPWTPPELQQWAAMPKAMTARLAACWLVEAGMAVHLPSSAPKREHGHAKFRLTMKGVDAAHTELARRAAQRKAQRRREKALDPDGLPMKLWRLLRIRTVLTAADAAQCLVDAGDDVASTERAASQYLRRWHQLAPQAVALSAHRVGGQRRYVLQRDLGPQPPTPDGPIGGTKA